MKLIPISTVAIVAALALCAPVHADTPQASSPISGPIDLRNQWPFQLPFLNFAPQSADIVGRGHQWTGVSLDIGNDLLIPSHQPNGVHIDTETQRLNVGQRWGLGNGLEAQAELPVEWRDGGFLDPLIETYHRLTGMDKPSEDDIPGRHSIPDYQSTIDISDPDGNSLFHAGAAAGLGDLTLALKSTVGRLGPLDAAARVAVKLPTGNADSFIGSGATDYGGDIDLTWRPTRRLTVDVDGSVVQLGHDTHMGALRNNDSIDHLMAALEYRVDGRTEWILQNDEAGRAVTVGNSFTDRAMSGIAIAFRRQCGPSRAWYAAFTENGDIANYDAPWLAWTGPDVTLSAGIEVAR